MNQGRKIIYARRITLLLVFVAVLASLAFDTGLGTPSAFGIGEFFLLCPLGGVEAMLASKTFIPMAALSLCVVLLFTLVFGRVWCAWGCPAPGIRSFFKRQPKNHAEQQIEKGLDPSENSACSSCSSAQIKETISLQSVVKNVAQDKRLWMLGGVLLITLIVGFPIFCLVCPIGLTFGTVSSLWHLIVDKQLTASLVVFPLCLVVELLIYRKWCVNLCPVAGLLSLFGRFAKLFRPRIDAATCLRYTSDTKCNVCATVCAENVNMHTEQGQKKLADCTRCGICVDACPTSSIKIKTAPSKPLITESENKSTKLF